MVSPSSSSTSRSTPCVLGCCGPMLTVMVSLRISAMADYLLFDEIAHRVNERAMYFLHSRREIVRDVDVHVDRRPDGAAATACECHRLQSTRFRILQACEHVCGGAARRDADCDVTGAAVRLYLADEDTVEPVIVGDRRHLSCIRRQRDRRQRAAFPQKAADELTREMLRVRGAAAVAEDEHLRAAAECGKHCVGCSDHGGNRFTRRTLVQTRGIPQHAFHG